MNKKCTNKNKERKFQIFKQVILQEMVRAHVFN